MLTFNNLIYRFFNNSNKNVYLLTDEFIHSKTFNMDIINLNPDTYFLSIICHCFIYKEYDISYKFQKFKILLIIISITKNKKSLLSNYFKMHKKNINNFVN